ARQHRDEKWAATPEARPGGTFPMAPEDVAVLLFPTASREENARQVIVDQSLLVLPRSTPRPHDVGFVVDEMLQHYRGVWNLEFTRREPWRERKPTSSEPAPDAAGPGAARPQRREISPGCPGGT